MRFGHSTVTRLTVLAALLLIYAGVFAALYWFTVRTLTGRVFGDAALRGAILTQDPVADSVDLVLDLVSVASLTGALAIVATIALVRLARITGLVALATMFAANGTSWLLKEALLTRPDLGLDEYAPATLNSMPSGHSTAVFSAVAAVLIVLPHRVRLAVGTAGGVFAVLTALATMSAGWHRPADSVASFLVVGGWVVVAAAALMLLRGPTEAASEAPAQGARWFGAFAWGAVALGAALVLALDAAAGFRDSAVGQTFSLLTGALVVAGAATGVLLVTLRVLELTDAAPMPHRLDHHTGGAA
ncbi:phosphatase PAP2 family protein [Nocardioides coralli]|uniref:phosphatase PAP2 family protein n=1 Tax=Nocardioides coralli TaxID=2872154 RepID=UPI001CA45A74|nr:phosphatase PAP2 family protein [Nocardioides coralli]QZY30313.1 phosphatase PAP2 family protein [Nocardioides coralli]